MTVSKAKTTGKGKTSRRRLERERRTIRFMIEIHCHDRHDAPRDSPDGLCDDCRELLAYAVRRIDHCPFLADKPTCARCPIHCYKPDMREKVREVMRHSGPRMMRRHPILAIFHLMDGVFKKKSAPPVRTPERCHGGKKPERARDLK